MTSTKGQLKSIFHDPVYYAKAMEEYAKQSSKYQVLATWADTVFPREIVEELAENITDHEKTLKVLGVGSGKGAMDCKMIGNLSMHFPKIANTVLEPAEDHINEYKKLAELKGLGKNDWEWRQQTWDEYVKEKKEGGLLDNTKFHFISAIHSLYYVDDLETTILDMFENLEEGGVLMVIMVADHSGFSRLWTRFRENIEDDMFTAFNAGSVRDILKKNKIDFKVLPQKSSVEITSCYEEGNENGQMIVDFLTHVVKLKQTAPPDFVEEVMTFLGSPECSVQNGDRLFFNNDYEAIVVTKKGTSNNQGGII